MFHLKMIFFPFLCYNIQHNDTQHEDTQHEDTQDNDSQQTDIQDNGTVQNVLSVAIKPITPNAIVM
jgi:hypothetical protein